jgi:hypothetical protein
VNRAVVFAFAVLGCCASAPSEPRLLTGDWGGVHVGLKLGPTGGTLDYDCAHGTIGPVRVDTGGSFVAAGTHTPEHGGPVREGEVLPTWRVRYDGVVRGERMRFQGRVETGVLLGPFELRRGAEPTIFRCL